MSHDTIDYKQLFAQMVIDRHSELLTGDEELRNAVIIKCVALLTIAFGIPATDAEDEPNIPEAMIKLADALETIERYKDERFTHLRPGH